MVTRPLTRITKLRLIIEGNRGDGGLQASSYIARNIKLGSSKKWVEFLRSFPVQEYLVQSSLTRS
jgi:hypothetical protein